MSRDLESTTQKLGRRLLGDLRHSSTHSPVDLVYDQLMDLTTADPKLKVELFRFVDTLPALSADQAVARHLREYLDQPGVRLPPLGRPILHRLGDGVLAKVSRFGARQMARRFIAGATANEAAAAVERMRKKRLGFTLDLLGEAVTSPADAQRYQQQYLDMIAAMADRARQWRRDPLLDDSPFGPVPAVNVSVKLSSLYAGFDPIAMDHTTAAVKDRLRPILRQAKARGVFVNVDMEQYDYRPITRRVFDEILMEDEFRDWSDVGIVIQAYLRDSAEDLDRLLAWAEQRGRPVWVRLVKGAYWDYETIIARQRGYPSPVFARKAETDANYERLTEVLITNWQHLRPAIASHNVRSVARAMAVAEPLPPGTVEYQVLLGMGDALASALAKRGHRVRVYTPFGQLLPGMAYLVRRLLENSSNESFLHKSHNGHAGELLLPPEAATPSRPVSVNGKARVATMEHQPRSTAMTFTNEPETDFSKEINQQAMRAAVEVVRGTLGRIVPIVINGREEISDNLVDRPDPNDTSRVASRVHYALPQQATKAIDAAAAAFPGWRDTPVETRADVLRKVARFFRERRFHIAAWEVFETGKPWREADADVAEAIDFCNYYAAQMLALSRGQTRNVPGEWNRYFYEPRGVCVVIAPWNFPLAILTGMTTAALVAGNTVVIKPAEQSSRVGLFLMDALQAAGVPEGVANYLPGDGEVVGPVLVNDPRVATIAFTGSRAVGLSIIRDAAVVQPGQRHVKRVIAEMGGKNAILVDEDADLDEAVVGVLTSATGFAGQKCSACSRVIVVGSAYGPFVTKLKEALQALRIGPADDPATTVGPVVDADARARILKYIDMGKNAATGVAAFSRYAILEPPDPDRGYYVPVAVFELDDPHHPIAQEEIFGPVLAVLCARDLTDAIAIADDSVYALTGGLYSRSPANIERVQREFRVGNLYINRKITGALVDRQPFGGARLSGVGAKAGGPDYLLQFLTPRTVTESVMRRGFAPE